MELKISTRFIYKNLGFTFFYIIVNLILLYYYDIGNNLKILIIHSTIVGTPLILALFCFFDYLRFETNRLIIIEDEMLYIEKKGVKRQIYSDQIKEVKLCAAPVFYRNSTFRLLPFEVFHYAEVKVKNQPSVYLTSLSDTELFHMIQEEPLFKGKITYKKSLFNSIMWNGLDK